ncbi:hypothetical protein ASC64_19520 [Nocardioides sp. Root122]|uniref:hypothetical protein n=1 Tax=Nocardioides TaxID=1839 RepID=UPI000702A45A|nr:MULTISPECIES: hypothetical protein [Nocardioides]KQV72833.1 hypothetical protein ASC64_19520 [Nocardioides sp. Root122]MCK9825906.1 hypothetical protein [Nocardioides cavernae]
MRHARTAGLVLATITTALTLAAPAQAAAQIVELQPQRLARGADVAVPHIEDGDFVDGARRVELPGTVARVIGRSGDAWLVGTNNIDVKRNRRVVRVEADREVVDVLRNIDPSTVVLSADGSTLAWQGFTGRGRKVTTYAASATDGTLLGSRGPGRYVDLLDVDADRVVLSNDSRVLQWRIRSGRTRTIVRKHGGMADIEHDLLTIWTKGPYRGGCTKLVRLSAPRMKHWTSCRDRVAAVSPDGTQVLTFHKLTDGVGPGDIRLRTLDGTRLATYRTSWFSGWGWESPGTLLLDVNGTVKSSTVRCTLDACENATDPVRAATP